MLNPALKFVSPAKTMKKSEKIRESTIWIRRRRMCHSSECYTPYNSRLGFSEECFRFQRPPILLSLSVVGF
ncbi:hypothetical protein V6N13_040902 [Hibiscus sabdariffa]